MVTIVFKVLANIWLGLVLIALACALLLFSDLGHRQAARPAAQLPRIAVLQWASTDLLDHVVQGLVEGLRRHGYEDGRTAHLKFLNASGDNATGNLMARSVVGGDYDLVLTASTLAMQAVAAANREGRVTHLFGGVTDPYGAGVGITGPEPHQHPPHLAGVGTFQPVDGALRVAREMNPALRRIGVVWNPGEDNSAACLKVARATCRELGIELLEANAGGTTEVPEAIRSLLARGIEAVWVGGDTVAIASLGAIVGAAQAARVPVFSNDPSDARRGALFGLGAAYRDVGIAVGEMAGQVLRGASPASFGVANLVPEVLAINPAAAEGLAGWSVPPALQARAQADLRAAAPAPRRAETPPAAPARPWEIRVVRYNDAQFSMDSFRGVMDGLAQQGLQEGRDFQVRVLNAQGDMTTLSSIMGAVRAETPDLLVTISTPALQAALRQAGPLPIIFCSVGDGVQAGAGKSVSNHLPNVTGITTRSPFAAMARLIRETVPGVRAVGTLFSPAEINSELYRGWFEEALREEGLRLEAVPVNTSADVAEATGALLKRDIQLVAQIADNTTRPAYGQIVKRATEAGLAFFCFDSAGMKDGAALAYARDYYHTGVEAAEVAVRVLRGEDPGGIPFANTRTEILVIQPDVLKQFNLSLPPEFQKKARLP